MIVKFWSDTAMSNCKDVLDSMGVDYQVHGTYGLNVPDEAVEAVLEYGEEVDENDQCD